MGRKQIIRLLSLVIVSFFVVAGYYVYSSFTAVPKMFKLNSELVSEGYYTGDFEFKMLGLAYYLDRGHYITSITKINQLNNQLKTKKGLIKIPKFKDKQEELEFYLNLQNPRTGAFMDDSYPLFTYSEPTINMVEKLEDLAKETGQPLKLKYPIKFLDKINTEEKLNVYLDDLSSVGWIASKFKTPFLAASTTIYLDELEANNLYTFSPEWKQALVKWFYRNQDSNTGFWGSKLRGSGKLLNSGDLGPTFHIIKLFLDDQGNNLYPNYPLRYKDEMFSTALKKLAEPMPKDADLDEIHDWSLTRYQGTKLLTNYLWKTASTENRNSARKLIDEIVRIKFEKFYISDKGSFSLYPGAAEPDLDGTGDVLSLLNLIGAYNRDRQEQLWGTSEKNILEMDVNKVSELKETDFNIIKNMKDINSIRVFSTDPTLNGEISNAQCIIYPKNTSILDIVELLPKLSQWVNTTSQTMGMWTSKESIEKDLSTMKIKPVEVFKENIPTKLMNDILYSNHELVVIGYDTLQIPRYKIVYKLVIS